MAPFALCAVTLAAVAPRNAHAFSCIDEAGMSTDYFAAIKNNAGSDVHYHDGASNGHFNKVSNMYFSKSAITATVKQLYGTLGSFAYALYNDNPPGSQSVSSSRAHSKGVILFDGSKGFWLVHSFPNWPGAVPDGYGGMPSTVFAQSFLCMTFSLAKLEDIAKVQMVQWPWIYSSGISPDLEQSLPNFVSWINGGRSTSSTITMPLRTYSGRSFTAYGKSAGCSCGLWDDIVGPGLSATDLRVQSWQNGDSNLVMPSCCKSSGCKLNIYNVVGVQFPDGCAWQQEQDHSKWAVTDASTRNACIGDINRQTSQSKRGGGAVCYNNANLWSAFDEIVTGYGECASSMDATSQNSSVSIVV